MAIHKKAKKRPSRPSFKLPDSFKDRTTKGGSKTKSKGKNTGGFKGVMPGDNFSEQSVLGSKKRKKKK